MDLPEFCPRLEGLLGRLADQPLPAAVLVPLMEHYESTGHLGQAEDMLFELFETLPPNHELLQFGLQFYRRLQDKSDEALIEGDLPREEVEQGLRDLHQKAQTSNA
jgi:hypothetical protein